MRRDREGVERTERVNREEREEKKGKRERECAEREVKGEESETVQTENGPHRQRKSADRGKSEDREEDRERRMGVGISGENSRRMRDREEGNRKGNVRQRRDQQQTRGERAKTLVGGPNRVATRFHCSHDKNVRRRQHTFAHIPTRLLDDITVAALATGSKCLGADLLRASPVGTLVHDSHAEVLARRCFQRQVPEEPLPSNAVGSVTPLCPSCSFSCSFVDRLTNRRFLFSELEQILCGQPSDYLEPAPPDQPWPFRLKPEVDVHLYISQAPCKPSAFLAAFDARHLLPAHPLTPPPNPPVPGGDASIFEMEQAPRSAAAAGYNEEPDAKRACRDDHRTGAKPVGEGAGDPCVPGVGYHMRAALRTKPGRGPKSYSMSCSDKIARWNIIGEASASQEGGGVASLGIGRAALFTKKHALLYNTSISRMPRRSACALAWDGVLFVNHRRPRF
jgi:hypothetical protein